MPQHTARLPIACVEGWSTTETWTGVPLADLARLAGVPNPTSAFVRSVERRGAFNRATLQANQVMHPDSLLALRVNDADLSPDHGLPGAHHRSGAARRAQHQVGRLHRFQGAADVRTALDRFRAVYGSHPLHLLTLIAGFALFGYVLATIKPATLWNPNTWWQSIIVWFAAAIIAHDLVLFPGLRPR